MGKAVIVLVSTSVFSTVLSTVLSTVSVVVNALVVPNATAAGVSVTVAGGVTCSPVTVITRGGWLPSRRLRH